jgi:glycosyltransferase involved in cell wall biosynthesis
VPEGRGIAFETRQLAGTPPGPAAARNAGLDLAGGPYIALLDSDDYWEPGLRIGRRMLELPLWFGRGYATAETYGGRVAALVRTSQASEARG